MSEVTACICGTPSQRSAHWRAASSIGSNGSGSLERATALGSVLVAHARDLPGRVGVVVQRPPAGDPGRRTAAGTGRLPVGADHDRGRGGALLVLRGATAGLEDQLLD